MVAIDLIEYGNLCSCLKYQSQMPIVFGKTALYICFFLCSKASQQKYSSQLLEWFTTTELQYSSQLLGK